MHIVRLKQKPKISDVYKPSPRDSINHFANGISVRKPNQGVRALTMAIKLSMNALNLMQQFVPLDLLSVLLINSSTD